MRKLLSIFILLFICSLSVFAEPLRLDMGMTLDEVAEDCGLGICIPDGMLRDFADAKSRYLTCARASTKSKKIYLKYLVFRAKIRVMRYSLLDKYSFLKLNFATSQLRNFATSQLRNFATSQLRNFATSQLRNFATSQLRTHII